MAQKVAIIGYGVEGTSAAKYWRAKGAEVTVCERNLGVELPSGVAHQAGEKYLDNLDQFDLIVRSPGIKPSLLRTSKPVTSVTNEFMEHCQAEIIGVTGTKGKGTTATLIKNILEAAGHTVWLGGNIGTPALNFLDKAKPEHYAVLELSSFQLMDCKYSPQTAVMLMISPDHLDLHTDMDEYTAAKARIFTLQKPEDIAVYNTADAESRRLGLAARSQRVPYNDPSGVWVDGETIRFQETSICKVGQVGLVGRHNLDNICAAIAATWHIVSDVGILQRVIAAFTGLEHRLELAGEKNGVKYYDDSFSTNPETAIAAMRAFSEPTVIILGGRNKGMKFDGLASFVVAQPNVKRVILVGESGDEIAQALDQVKFSNYQFVNGSMREVVGLAERWADGEGVVLLSPASNSLDMYKNYKDRGNQFQAAVANL